MILFVLRLHNAEFAIVRGNAMVITMMNAAGLPIAFVCSVNQRGLAETVSCSVLSEFNPI